MKKLLAASLLAASSLGFAQSPDEQYMYFLNEANNVLTKLFLTKCDDPNAPDDWKNLVGIFPEDFPSPKAGKTVKGCWVVHDGHIDIVVDDGSQVEGIDPAIFKPGPAPAIKTLPNKSI